MIYFITQEGKKYIKIGYTSKPIKERLSSMQTGNPHLLSVCDVVDGGKEYEKKY